MSKAKLNQSAKPHTRSPADSARASPPAASLRPPPYGIELADRMGEEVAPGTPLSPGERAWFEPRLATDLGRVRIHEGAQGARVTVPLGAAAVTKVNDIYLSPDAPSRETVKGRRTLAHELAHVAQFDAGRDSGMGTVEGADQASLEREASMVASIVSRGESAQVRGRAGPDTPPLLETKKDASSPAKTSVRLVGFRIGHMASVGMTLYYEIELPVPMARQEVYDLLFEGGKPPVLWTVAPLPKGAKVPARNWLIGGPYHWLGVSGYGGKSFNTAIKDPVGKELEDQFFKLDLKPTQPSWFSQATVDAVQRAGGPPAGVDVKLAPKDGSTISVWREGDVWYWFDASTGELQGFWADPSKTSFGEERYNRWVVQYIELGRKPADAMDQAVKDMQEANVAILGAFAMSLASAPGLSRPPAIGTPSRLRVTTGRSPGKPPIKAKTDKPPVKTDKPSAQTKPKAQGEAKSKPKSQGQAKEPYRPCFIAGTRVPVEGGVVLIEQIATGTNVLARAEGASHVAHQKVTATHGGATRTLFHVHAGSVHVTCTGHHPFHVDGKGWVQARDLAAGDQLESADGEPVIVSAVVVQRLEAATPTFNMTVAEASTYFVCMGDRAVLVHNGGGPPPDYDGVRYWFFGSQPRARPSEPGVRQGDTDGISMWKTQSREQVNTLFETRVKEGAKLSEAHGCLTSEQLDRAGLVAPETPGDPKSSLTGKLSHHSVRPASNPDPTNKLTDAEIKDLDATAKKAGGTVVRPRDLQC